MLTRCLPHVALFILVLPVSSLAQNSSVLPSFSSAVVPPFHGTALHSDDFTDPLGDGCRVPPRMYVGLVGSVVLSRHANPASTTRFTGLDANSTTVSGTGWNAGLLARYFLGDPRDSHHSLSVCFQYSSMPTTAESTVNTPIALGMDNATQVQAQYNNETDYAVMSMDAFYNYCIAGSRFCLMAGPSLGVVVGSEQREQLSIADGTSERFITTEESQQRGVQFEDGNRTAVAHGDIEELTSLRFSLQGALGYEITMKRIILLPYVLYEHPLTSGSSKGNWNVSAIRIGVLVLAAL